MTFRTRRRSFLLMVVALMLALVSIALSALSYDLVRMHEVRRRENLQRALRAAVVSTIGYVEAHRAEWLDRTSNEDTEIDIGLRLPPHVSGVSRIRINAEAQPPNCQIHIELEHPKQRLVKEIERPL